jgi:hypothetical protein
VLELHDEAVTRTGTTRAGDVLLDLPQAAPDRHTVIRTGISGRSPTTRTGRSAKTGAQSFHNPFVRWGTPFFWISVAALVAALFSQIFQWEVLRDAVLIAWVVLLLLVAMTRGMRWTSALTFLSVAALLGAVISQLAGWQSVRGWFLLAWAVLLLPVAIALLSHPMRWPAWGLFVGFWGVVGALWLIVLQILAVTGGLGGEAYGEWTAWPLALLGIWLVVASGLGLGAERFPRWVDGLGLLAGIGLLAISTSTWIDAPDDATRVAGLFAAIAYVLWGIGLGWVLWGAQDVTHRFRGLPVERTLKTQSLT